MNQHHVISKAKYLLVYIALLALLGLTVGAAYVELGIWTVAVTLTIAIAKALLIILYFMHARYSGRLVAVAAGAAFVWLGIMISLTLYDYLSRGWLSAPGA
jgi:cytochrome c oxidase subunit 4